MQRIFKIFTFLFVLLISAPAFAGFNMPPILNPANGHYYECVDGCGDWFDARDFASDQVFMNMRGHLATVTDAGEQNFINQDLGCSGWLGGMQAEGAAQPDEDWEWITGEPFIFTAWADGEPNDSGCNGEEGCENCLETSDEWNDESCNSNRSCIIEYEPSCQIDIVNDALPPDNTLFEFTLGGNGSGVFTLSDPQNPLEQLFISEGNTVTVTEDVPLGWELSISCELISGDVDMSLLADGVSISCLNGNSVAECTFLNQIAPRPIPTLSEWGLIAMAGVIGIIAFVALRRKQARPV